MQIKQNDKRFGFSYTRPALTNESEGLCIVFQSL